MALSMTAASRPVNASTRKIGGVMETCTRCGADTELYYQDVLICLRCSDALEREIQQRDSQILKSELARDGALGGSKSRRRN